MRRWPRRAQTDGAATHISALQKSQPGACGVRLGIVNDWGSYTGFSYTLAFVMDGSEDKSDERVALADGGTIYIARKALWAGEGGLLGATVDMDAAFNLKVTPKEPGAGRAGAS